MNMDEKGRRRKFWDEVKKEVAVRRRLLWMEKGKSKVDLENLAEVIEHVDNFYNMAPNLLNANNEKFERWFEKLYRLDKRVLIFYVVAQREKITAEQWEFVKEFFEMRNPGIEWETVEKLIG